MPGFTAVARNRMLEAQRAVIDEISLHTADSATGANEVSGGGYARIAVTSADFDASSGGEFLLNNDLTFAGPAAGACGFFGHWVGGVFQGMGANTGDTTFNAAGAYILKTGTSLGISGV